MRLRRFRFTLRWMMVAVAIAGGVVGIRQLSERKRAYFEKALIWSRIEENNRERLSLMRPLPGEGTEAYRERRVWQSERVAYIAQIRENCERVARWPWMFDPTDSE